MAETRFPVLHAVLTGEPAPQAQLVQAWHEAKDLIAEAEGKHAKVIPLRSKLKSLTHLRLVEGV